MIVRREREMDAGSARAVQVAAFARGDEEPPEAQLLDELRSSDAWIPALSWVAESEGRIVGHNVGTRGWAGGTSCVAVGPIGVEPDMQRNGVGSSLMYALIGAADAMDEPLVALLGSPGYYSRFGFVPSTELGVAAPDPEWREYFQILPLSGWTPSITGTFKYAEPFDRVS